MRAVSAEAGKASTGIIRPVDRETDRLVGSVLADVALALWPENTAPYIATAAKCSVRAAERYLGGQRQWSGDAITAIVAEILKRHAMRNVKIVKRR